MAEPDGSEGRAKLAAILRRRRRARALRWLGVLLVLGLVGGALWLLRERRMASPPEPAESVHGAAATREEPPPRTPAPERAEDERAGTASPPAPPPPEPEPLPTLQQSDAVVRDGARTLSDDPRLDIWLGVEGLLRRFVLAVVNVQEGRSPREPLAHLAPSAAFRARTDDEGRLFTDPASYARYDGVAAGIASLDAAACAELYRRFEPLLDAVYAEIGLPDEPLRAAVARAAAEILAAPRVVGRPQLVYHVNHYRYRDPSLEDLSEAQKLVLRTGPENARRIQAKVREIARALGIPDAKLPATPEHRVAAR